MLATGVIEKRNALGDLRDILHHLSIAYTLKDPAPEERPAKRI
jgi:hypothetical protein